MLSKKTRSIFKPRTPDKQQEQFESIYSRFREFTMIPKNLYLDNLKIAEKARNLEGDVVECGVWRGGMVAGIAELFRADKNYYLFDSFEGLPPAKDIDGVAAKEWQKNPDGEFYNDNCKAEIDFAIKAMDQTGASYKCIKGWFSETLKDISFIGQISLLRLDGDWYESTMECLTALFPKVVEGGIIIIDDYYAWTGCSRAVHDYLSSIQSASRIWMSSECVAYIVKTESKS